MLLNSPGFRVSLLHHCFYSSSQSSQGAVSNLVIISTQYKVKFVDLARYSTSTASTVSMNNAGCSNSSQLCFKANFQRENTEKLFSRHFSSEQFLEKYFSTQFPVGKTSLRSVFAK